MQISSSKFKPTDAVLNVPMALAERLYPAGLTAPQMRAAIVLLSHVDVDGRFLIMKPHLEEMAELRIDNGVDFLRPIIDSLIGGMGGEEAELWFEDIEYRPGIRRKTAGVIAGELSSYGKYHLQGDPGVLPIRVEEFRSYSSVYGLLLRLRIGAWFHRHPGDKRVKLRLKDHDVYDMFGDYCGAARRRRPDGDYDITLGRLLRSVLVPGAEQINGISDEFTISVSTTRKATGAVGRALDHIDLTATRIEKRVSIRDLAKMGRHREKLRRA